jgi:release factor glutamine methyltransferase
MDAAARIDAPADTPAQLLRDATPRLAAAGSRSPRLDAEVLLAAACRMDRTALYVRARERTPEACRATFAAMLSRRIAGEPVQYIVGRQEFWSLDFIVTPDVLIPRPETELLVELALNGVDERRGRAGRPRPYSQGESDSFGVRRGAVSAPGLSGPENTPRPRICDLGTGSGCLAIALAHELPQAEIWAVDLSEAALQAAKANARRHAVDDRIHFVAGDLFVAVSRVHFDAIVCNPPYVSATELASVPPEVQREPRRALDGGADGLEVIRRVVAGAPARLVDGGWLIMEIGATQGPAVTAMAPAAGLRAVSVHPDYAGLPRALCARK